MGAGPVRATLAGAALVMLGVVTGITLDRVLLTSKVGTAGETRDAQAEMVVSLRAEFDLDSAQVAEIEAILTRHQVAVTDAWETIGPRLRAAMDTARSEIEGVLPPEERERFRRWLREQHGNRGTVRERVHRP